MKADKANIMDQMTHYHEGHVIQFRKAVGNALSRVYCQMHPGGFAWLVDTKTTYELRINKKVTEVPMAPTQLEFQV